MPEDTALDLRRLTPRQQDHARRSFTRLTDTLAVRSADLIRALGQPGQSTARAITGINTLHARAGEVVVTEQAGRFAFGPPGDALEPLELDTVTFSRAGVLDSLGLRMGAEAGQDQGMLNKVTVQAPWVSGPVWGETREAVRKALNAELPENRDLARVLDGGTPAVLFLCIEGADLWLLVFRAGESLHVRLAKDFTELVPHARALRPLGLWPEGTGGK